MLRFLSIVLVLLSLALSTTAQTYRGAINGTVTDPSGAVIPDAEVKARNKATDVTTSTTSTSDGQFAFQDLPVGTYVVSVDASGFPEMTVDNVMVTQGSVYTLPVKLTMSQQATTVEVSAATLSLDTTTETQTTTVTGEALQDMPLNGRDFTQLISITPGFGGYSAGGYGSLNG
ncbi:MAG TPA: carboxypeptidase-like regulatory domain-containing protein, partial [Candidatus Dormibacteraeota bacterium]|nr:carboxypeptidase-like regulatory domain-containing protein [Candidatus Dormibacteraeota bacterium]